MGSLIVRNYIQKYDYEIDGLIICGSPSYNKLTKVGKVVCKLFMVVKDERYCSKLMQKMFLVHLIKDLTNRMNGSVVTKI